MLNGVYYYNIHLYSMNNFIKFWSPYSIYHLLKIAICFPILQFLSISLQPCRRIICSNCTFLPSIIPYSIAAATYAVTIKEALNWNSTQHWIICISLFIFPLIFLRKLVEQSRRWGRKRSIHQRQARYT